MPIHRLLCALSAVLLVGCPPAPGLDAGPPLPPNEQFCVDVNLARVDFYARCKVAGDAELSRLRSNARESCATLGWTPSLATGHAVPDEARAADCLATLRAQRCNGTERTSDGFPLKCYAVDRGVLVDGESCFVSDDCEPQLFCRTDQSCPGRCAPRLAFGDTPDGGVACPRDSEVYDGKCAPLVAIGESCIPTGSSLQPHGCVELLPCRDGVCQVGKSQIQTGAPGAPCGDFVGGCSYGTVCVGGQCRTRAELGATCDPGQCLLGAFCDPSSQCAPTVELGGACGGGAECATGLSCFQSRCIKKLPLAGEPCPDGICAVGHSCTADGSCAVRKRPGAECTTADLECDANLYCASGTCQPRKPAAAACTAIGTTDECSSGSCSNGSCTQVGHCSAR